MRFARAAPNKGDHKLDVVAGLQSDNVTGSQTTT